MPPNNQPIDPRAGTGAAGPVLPGQAAFGQRNFGNTGVGIPQFINPMTGAQLPVGGGAMGVQQTVGGMQGSNLAGSTSINQAQIVPQGTRGVNYVQPQTTNPYAVGGDSSFYDYYNDQGQVDNTGQAAQDAIGANTGVDPVLGGATYQTNPFPTNDPRYAEWEQFQATRPVFEQAFPGLNYDPNAQTSEAFTIGGDLLDAAGLEAFAGPFRDNPFLLPEHGVGAGLGLNIELQQAIRQQGRSENAEDMLRNLVGLTGTSTAAQAGEFLAGGARDLVAPGALDALQASEQERIRETTAAQTQAAEQAARDRGAFGGGGSAADTVAAIQQNALQSRLGAERDLQADIEALRESRLGVADTAARGATDIFRATQVDPQLRLAATLQSPENQQIQNLIDSLFDIQQLQSGLALQDTPDNFFDAGGGSLLGGVIGGVGNVVGGILSQKKG